MIPMQPLPLLSADALLDLICKLANRPTSCPPEMLFEHQVRLSSPKGRDVPDAGGRLTGRIDVFVPYLGLVLELKLPLVPRASSSSRGNAVEEYVREEWQTQVGARQEVWGKGYEAVRLAVCEVQQQHSASIALPSSCFGLVHSCSSTISTAAVPGC